ncbi:hypothetical protein K353_06691, partial [Kitasatospora sp. SolWspMP-SS2h]
MAHARGRLLPLGHELATEVAAELALFLQIGILCHD